MRVLSHMDESVGAHQCACPCHTSALMIRHAGPCCMRCNVCGQNIRVECLKEHAKSCQPGAVQRRVAERLAAIEDTLMDAVLFYADPDNWKNHNVEEDFGERARRALASLPAEPAQCQEACV